MGRANIKLELIKNEKSRNLAFKKRKGCLIQKMHEFTTLCDVSACMIIYGPKQEDGAGNGAVEPDVWPQNPVPIIESYKARNPNSKNKTFGLNDFFNGRKKKMEDELSKLRKSNMESCKYPTHLDDNMKKWTQGQLREFAASLGNKAEYVKARIEFLKSSSNMQGTLEANNNMMHFGNTMLNGQFYPPMHVPILYNSSIDQHQQQNSLMMHQMNGGANFQSAAASYSNPIFNETASSSSAGGVVNYHEMKAFGHDYGEGLPPLPAELWFPPADWENYCGMYDQMKNGETGYQI